jgi:hypothetical protein
VAGLRTAIHVSSLHFLNLFRHEAAHDGCADWLGQRKTKISELLDPSGDLVAGLHPDLLVLG